MVLDDLKPSVVEVRPGVEPAGLTQQQLVQQGEEVEALEKTYGLWHCFKQNKRVLVYTLAAYSCAAVYGYDSIANTATLGLPSFSLYFGQYDPIHQVQYIDSLWASLWASMTGLGQIFGSAVAGPLSQKIGRRYTGICFALVTVVGVALQYVATSKGLLLAGKMVNGFAVGALLSVGTTYASEIAPPRIRGVLLGGMAFFLVAMQTIGLVVVSSFVNDIRPSAFRKVFALQWVVGSLPIIPFFLVPESPNFLLLKGHTEAARESLSRIHGPSNSIDVRLAHLQNNILTELKEDQKASYINCFKGTNCKRTLTVCLIQLGTGLVGSAFLTQNIYFLSLSGLPIKSCFDVNIGGFVLALIIMPISGILVESFGRRPIYLTGVIGNIIILAVVGGLGYTPPTNTTATWVLAVLLNLLISWQLITISLISWSMPPELSSYKLRQPTQSINIMMQAFTSWVFAFVTPYIYNVGKDSGNLGAKTGFVFIGSSIVLLVMAWVLIPETRGLGIEEIDWLYEKGVSPRKFTNELVPSKKKVDEGIWVHSEKSQD